MKNKLFVALQLSLFLVSCDIKRSAKMFAAGAYTYSEHIKIDCPSDSIIKNLLLLKKDSVYRKANAFTGALHQGGDSFYSCYFFSRRKNFLLHLNVPLHHRKATVILLVNIKDYRADSTTWQDFNRDIPESRQKEALDFFNTSIRPHLTCK